MSEEDKREERIFDAAIEIANRAERAAYLTEACGPDQQLRAKVEALLLHHEKGGIIDKPPFEVGVTLDDTPLTEGPGTKIGRYKLLELIGEGGFGVVYMAEQAEPIRRKVALKIIKLGMDTKQVIARFEAERQALAMMEHPNIARVFDAGATDTGRPYFVMELVKGISITEYCDKNNLDTNDRLQLFIDVCKAVQHAHQKGIIHRDIKPSNVMITLHDGVPVPKIIDFGIAKATSQRLTEKTLFTRYAHMIGTPQYMSPEQAEMSALDVDTRSDIYSLGVLLYELLTGATPFDAQTLREAGYNEMQRIIREEEPARPSTKLSTLGEALADIARHRRTEPDSLTKLIRGDLDWVVMKTLEKDRTRRYETANGLAREIERHLADEPVVAGPPSTVYRMRKFVRRNRALVTSVAVVLAVLVMGIVVSTIFAIGQARARTEADAAKDKADQARNVAEQAREKETAARSQAEQAEKVAEERGEEYRHLSYVHGVALADAKYHEGNIRCVRELLDSCPEDLRGWEWYRLNYIMDEALITFSPPSRGWRVAFSPDGKSLISGNTDGTITVWDVATGTEVRTLREHEGWVNCVAVSHDGTYLVSGGRDKTIRLWDVNNGHELMTIQTHEGIRSIAFNPDGTQIVSSGYGKKPIQVWDANNGENILTIQVNDNWINQIALSPDGSRIIAGSIGKLIQWDAATGEKIGVLELEKKDFSAYCISYSPDGTRVAVGCLHGGIMVLNIVNSNEVMCIEGSGRGRDMVTAIAFSPDGRRVIAGGRDQIIKILDAETGDRISTLIGHQQDIMGLALTKDGKRIASTSVSGQIKIWDSEKDRERTVLKGHDEWVQDMVFSPDGKQLISASEDKTIKVWDVSEAREISMLRGHEGWINCVAVSHDGTYLVSGGRDKTIRLWDIAEAQQIWSIAGHEWTVYSVAFSPDDKRIASVSGDQTVKVWDAATGTELMTLLGHEGYVYSVAFSPDGKRIVSSGEKAIKVWDVSTGENLMTLSGHKNLILSVMFTPDGKRIVSGSYDETIRVWDAATGEELRILHGHKSNIQALAMSRDGTRIVSGSHDCTAKVWDLATGAELMTLPAGELEVLGIAFSPDGKTIAAACSSNGNITLWESAEKLNNQSSDSAGPEEAEAEED